MFEDKRESGVFLDLSLFLLLFGEAQVLNTRVSAPQASKFLGRRLIDRVFFYDDCT